MDLDRLRPDLRDEVARRLRNDALWSFAPLPQSDGQRRFWTAANAIGHEKLVLLGGNRSGKSETAGAAAARQILFRVPRMAVPRNRPRLYWVVGKTYEDAGEVLWKEKLKRYIHPRNIAAIAYRSRTKDWPSMIRTTQGVEIVFKASEQGRTAFQGLPICGAWIDEQFPEDVFGEIETRCLDYGGGILASLTPIDPDPFLAEIYVDQPEGWRFFEIDIDDNRVSRGGVIADDAVDRWLALIPDQLRETRKSGRFAQFEGTVYPEFSRQSHVVEFDLDPSWTVYRAIDPGWSAPFVCLWIARDADGAFYVFDELYETMLGVDEAIGTIVRRSTGMRIATTFPDPGGEFIPKSADRPDVRISTRRALTDAGIEWTLPVKSLYDGIQTVQEYLHAPRDAGGAVIGQPRLFIHPRCRNLIREMSLYRWESGTDRRHASDAPMKLHDHAPDALRYCVHTVASRDGATEYRRLQNAERPSVGVFRRYSPGKARDRRRRR